MAKITTDTTPPIKTLQVGKSNGFGMCFLAMLIVLFVFMIINHFVS